MQLNSLIALLVGDCRWPKWIG